MTVEQVGYLNAGAPTRNPFNYAKVEQTDRDNTTRWLELSAIANQLNLFEDESQDDYLSALELAVRQAIEDYIGLSIFPTSYRVWYNAASLFGTPLTLDLPEVSQNFNPALAGVTINAVKYWTQATPPVLVTVSNTEYYYDPSGNKVVLSSLPSNLNSSMTSPVYCEYTTVANPLASYPVIQQAGLLLFVHLYNNRSNTSEASLKDIPFGVSTLLRPYKPLVM
ncbi:gp6 domain containing protein [uncultured Caudovirales phage]|uniref:Gp6 domain containing protein n=1 Tax=uncultured Caudovirales phage TaxID=2100421 RepID=A0A6J5RQZ2_9CAUD|nr:gp6 domain containing protein [uncultured Caudovirales phage]CAB4199673.1 gp6 domain containing protein [uncultured Caudovirales phage]